MTRRERVTSPNKVCPQCAEGFALGGIVLPTMPVHDLCMGTVPDRDAPGGGWDCQCPCRRDIEPGIPSAESFGKPIVIQHPPEAMNDEEPEPLWIHHAIGLACLLVMGGLLVMAPIMWAFVRFVLE